MKPKMLVCSADEVEALLEVNQLTHIISIGDPDQAWPADFGDRNLLRLTFHDVGVASAKWSQSQGYKLPTLDDVKQIIEFSKSLTPASRMLVHCQAGISRSPAAAIIALAANNPTEVDSSLVRFVFNCCTNAGTQPNTLMLSLAESLLGRQAGSLQAIVKEMLPSSCSPYNNW